MKPSILILPNENVLDVPLYFKELNANTLQHGKGVHDFSDLYNLGLNSESLGLPNGVYVGNRYQIALCSLGHACICFDEEIWIFCPEFMSQKQKEWFIKKKLFFWRHQKRMFYAIVANDKSIISSGGYSSRGNRYKKFYKYILNNELYEERGMRK